VAAADGVTTATVRILLIDEDELDGCIALSDADGRQAIVLPALLFGTQLGAELIGEATMKLAELWPVCC
jgi:hypothetical protein